MIPTFSNRNTKIDKSVEKKNIKVENIQKNNKQQKKLGDHALYKFITNRRR